MPITQEDGTVVPGTNAGDIASNTPAAQPADVTNGQMTNVQWAQLVLQDLGAPATGNNITTMLQWMASEEPPGSWWDRNNPLNESVGNGSTDGTGTNSSLTQGALNTVQMINQQNMSGIKAALMANADPGTAAAAIQASPWASSHYGNGANWYSGSVPEVTASGATIGTGTPSTGGAGATGTSLAGASGQTATPQIPSINDIPALNQYIQANYPQYAFLLSIPSVAGILDNATAAGDNSTQLQAAVENTDWWRTTSAAQKNYQQNVAQNPADYSLTTPGSTAQQVLSQVQAAASSAGVTLTDQQAQVLTQNYMEYGWNATYLTQQIGQLATVAAPGTSATGGQAGQVSTNAGSILQQLTSSAANYFQQPTSGVLQQWAQQIASGDQTLQSYNAFLAQQAALQFPTMAAQIQAGNTPSQIMDSTTSAVANLMEVDPTSVNYVSDPLYQKILNYTPPDVGGAPQAPRPMSQSQALTYLRGTPQWSTTQNARDAGAGVEQSILNTFGKLA